MASGHDATIMRLVVQSSAVPEGRPCGVLGVIAGLIRRGLTITTPSHRAGASAATGAMARWVRGREIRILINCSPQGGFASSQRDRGRTVARRRSLFSKGRGYAD